MSRELLKALAEAKIGIASGTYAVVDMSALQVQLNSESVRNCE